MRRVVALAVALTLLGACSSDDEDGAVPVLEDTTTSTSTTSTTSSAGEPAPGPTVSQQEEFDVPDGTHPHDVAVSSDGIVWYTAQHTGKLGRLDPRTKQIDEVPLGSGSSPHGVVMGPDGAPWVTDTGLNAIVRVDPATKAVSRFDPAKEHGTVGMHTAAFDQRGRLWFTGSAGFVGRLDPASRRMDVFRTPRGAGPYGIAVAPNGDVYYANLAKHYMGKVDPQTGAVTVLEPPTRNQGTRRVWSDSKGVIWSSQWDAGQVASYDPASGRWKEWRLPGAAPKAYSVYVDDKDKVWLTDFGASAVVRFDPATEQFTSFPNPSKPGNVRQQLGRPGEVWGAESANDKLLVIRTR